MKVYLAAPYAIRDTVVRAGGLLTSRGHVITSRWIQATHDILPGVLDAALDHTDDYTVKQVAGDLADIDAADALIVFTSAWAMAMGGLRREQATSGGRHIETGYALAKGKRVIVVGVPENIFHRGACTVVATLGEAWAALEEEAI